MVLEYNELFYSPSLKRAELFAGEDFRRTRQVVQRDQRITGAWPQVRILRCDVGHMAGGPVYLGDRVPVTARVRHPGLSAEDLVVELVTAAQDTGGHEHDPMVLQLECVASPEEGVSLWKGEYVPAFTGPRSYGVRVLPSGAEGRHGIDLALGLVHWA
jgi:hypothetical protein